MIIDTDKVNWDGDGGVRAYFSSRMVSRDIKSTSGFLEALKGFVERNPLEPVLGVPGPPGTPMIFGFQLLDKKPDDPFAKDVLETNPVAETIIQELERGNTVQVFRDGKWCAAAEILTKTSYWEDQAKQVKFSWIRILKAAP